MLTPLRHANPTPPPPTPPGMSTLRPPRLFRPVCRSLGPLYTASRVSTHDQDNQLHPCNSFACHIQPHSPIPPTCQTPNVGAAGEVQEVHRFRQVYRQVSAARRRSRRPPGHAPLRQGVRYVLRPLVAEPRGGRSRGGDGKGGGGRGPVSYDQGAGISYFVCGFWGWA